MYNLWEAQTRATTWSVCLPFALSLTVAASRLQQFSVFVSPSDKIKQDPPFAFIAAAPRCICLLQMSFKSHALFLYQAQTRSISWSVFPPSVRIAAAPPLLPFSSSVF